MFGLTARRRLREGWPDPKERERARLAVAQYGLGESEAPVERVRVAILELSEGSTERIPDLVAKAEVDFRDVLMWAEQRQLKGAK